MSTLVTVIAKFYDRSGARVINLDVKSRYQGSARENLGKTNFDGHFIFQASPNRIIEILAKPPKAIDYIIFKTINSSIQSSIEKPVEVKLPKTIDEYRNEDLLSKTTKNGLVTTIFKVLDSDGKVMANFPVKTRPKGKSSFERATNEEGILEVQSSPNRDIEFLVLNTSDQFILKKAINSGSGSMQPIPIQLDESCSQFVSRSEIIIVDREGNTYDKNKVTVEMEILETKKKEVYIIKNGKLPIKTMVGQKLQFKVFNPDGKSLEPALYIAKRIKEKSLKLKLDVDVVEGATDQGEPKIDKTIGQKVTCKICGKSLSIDMEFIKVIAPKAK